MVKGIIWLCGFLTIVVSGMAFAGTADLAGWVFDQTSFLANVTLPESASLILLGSALISGASFLRRKWQGRMEDGQ